MKMLERYVKDDALRFHMPGHKGLARFPGAAYDVTEFPGSDCLFDPHDGILRAQQEAARCWGAGQSFLLVNGSTSGVHAMVLWAAMEGRTLFLPRDCHVSAIYACAAAGIQPEWLDPVWNAREQIVQWDGGVASSGIASSGVASSGAAALFITSPDYYGRCTGIAGLMARLRGGDCVVLTDAAHGAHFAFSPRLPQDTSLSALWVTGAHKTLPAPTQTAHLHVAGGIDASCVDRVLRGITTTSPSYLLMAGLDQSRLYMQTHSDRLEALIDDCTALAIRLNSLDGLRCWQPGDVRGMGYAAQDPTRLVVDVRGLGMTGWEAGARLRALGVQAEMCDSCRVVLIATVMDGKDRLDRLYGAFVRLTGAKQARPPQAGLCGLPPRGETVMAIRQAWLAKSEEVPLKDAEGSVAAEPFCAYPPGMPLCMPGEMISRDVVAAVRETQALGGSFYGIRRGSVMVVK